MTKEVRENKALRVFTFILVTITIIGVPITLFLKTEYAKMYQLFLKRSYKKIEKLYNDLSPEQKEALKNYVKKNVTLSKNEVLKLLVKNDKVDLDKARKIVNVGSKIVKEVIKKVEKKLK